VRIVQERSLALEDVMDTLIHALPRRGVSVELCKGGSQTSPYQLIIRQPNGGAATVTVERLPDRVLTTVVRLPRCKMVMEGDEELIEVVNMTLLRGGG
jgi:hypothetical protein